MRTTILLSVLLAFLGGSADAYTAILKSGKKIEGSFVKEDETTIQI
jgi:hypothetical protein